MKVSYGRNLWAYSRYALRLMLWALHGTTGPVPAGHPLGARITDAAERFRQTEVKRGKRLADEEYARGFADGWNEHVERSRPKAGILPINTQTES
jgi:hypothetical protein